MGGALADYVAFRRLGSFTSGGSSDFAALNSFEGALTGASGDTWGLFGSAFQSSVTTQGSDTIATVAQVLIKEPVITVGSGATVTNSAALYIYSAATEATNDYALWVDAGAVKFDSTLAVGGALTASGAINATSNVEIDGTLTLAEYIYHKADTDTYMRFQTNAWTLRTGGTDAISVNSSQDVTIGGDLVVSGTGPHAFGGAILDYAQFHFTGSFTSGGASTTMTGILGNLALTGASGDTGSLVGTRLAGSHATQTATESIGYIAQLAVEEPHITDNLTGDITVATTVYIKSAPTEGESNYALFVDAGVTRLDGNVLVGNTVTNPASGFSNQAGLGLVAATGNLEVSANNSVALELGRYGGTGNIQSFRYAGTSIGYFAAPTTSTLDLALTGKLYLDGGSNTYIEQGTTDRFDVVAGGVTAFHVAETGSAPHGIEVKSYGNLAIAGITEQTGSYTSQATSDNEACMTVSSTMTGHANNTGHLTGLYVNNSFVVPASTTVGLIAQMRINTPGINLDATSAAVTNTASFYIEGAPAGGGTNNYAGLIDAGAWCIDANFLVGARTAGANGYGANSAGYIRTSTATFNTLTLDHNVSVPSGTPSILMTTAAGNTSQSYYHIRCVSDRDDSDATVFQVMEDGNVTLAGALSKGSGSFKIDHPLPEKKDTHSLYHSFIEGPRADLNYRGTAELSGGWAQVDLDESADMTAGTWELLCRDPQCWIQNDSGWSAVRGSVEGSVLTIECADSDSSDSVSWLVVAERCDEHMMETDWTDETGKVIVEQEKVAEPPMHGPSPEIDVEP
jgi:hypothetical protein